MGGHGPGPCGGKLQGNVWTRRGLGGVLAGLLGVAALAAPAQDVPEADRAPLEFGAIEDEPAPAADLQIAVMPFRLHSADGLSFLSESLDELLAARIEASGEVGVVARERLAETLGTAGPTGLELSDAELRAVARQLDLDAIVAGSLTELAGRFSLDARVVSVEQGGSTRSLVLTASSDRELLERLSELSSQVVATVRGDKPDRIVELRFEGGSGIEADLEAELTLRPGVVFDSAEFEADRRRISKDPRVANVEARSIQRDDGIELVYRIVRAERLLGEGVRRVGDTLISELEIRGNRRVEADAIRARIRSLEGTLYDPAQIARDVRAVFQQGFFRDVRVYTEEVSGGLRVVFEVEESPVVREIAISGNENVDGDKIREILTLTTGSPLDFPLLRENVDRIAALYRSEGYYLARVDFEIEPITEGSIAINFEVDEREKLRLREIAFRGNEAFSDSELREGFTTKTWKFYSLATSWFDKTGTYSEPVFLRDLRLVEKKYADNGYVQARVSEPVIDANEEGLFIEVEIDEGEQFQVGDLVVQGDETIDLEALRKKIRLDEGEVFSRSDLTSDVETLEAHYTDRGFFFANVSPITQSNPGTNTVDVQFVVEKGPLYFVRNIDIQGNTRTVDPVIRREIRLVEGQLYSARALQVSSFRIRRLGFFEDVAFEPNTTEDPSQLDLDVSVVERPTGSFSFGAGFSSADNFIFTASLAQANLFGRGYGVNLSADIGGRSQRFFLSLTDPYFLGSTFSFSATAFLTQIQFNDFEQTQTGFEVSLGHPLTIDNRASVALRYGFSQRDVSQEGSQNAVASPIERQILQESQTTSQIGISLGIDTRNDRFAPTSGYAANGSIEYAGLGGFSNFLKLQGQGAYYFGAPDWLLERSTFVVSTRLGFALPFNSVGDFDLGVSGSTICADPSNCLNAGNLDEIDDDITLPLTERYFLGGLGRTQLRGFEGRSVGPRRAELRFTDVGSGRVYHPVGTRLISNPATGQLAAVCDDVAFNGNFGDGDGTCNQIDDEDIDDFDDIDETQVIGGASFISSSFEYRFPISEQIGLMGVAFVDGGNAFAEGEVLFDASEWRYGYGGGVLWFSPFGPLQLVLGFPVNPRSFEDSPVFEFSVGGLGL